MIRFILSFLVLAPCISNAGCDDFMAELEAQHALTIGRPRGVNMRRDLSDFSMPKLTISRLLNVGIKEEWEKILAQALNVEHDPANNTLGFYIPKKLLSEEELFSTMEKVLHFYDNPQGGGDITINDIKKALGLTTLFNFSVSENYQGPTKDFYHVVILCAHGPNVLTPIASIRGKNAQEVVDHYLEKEFLEMIKSQMASLMYEAALTRYLQHDLSLTELLIFALNHEGLSENQQKTLASKLADHLKKKHFNFKNKIDTLILYDPFLPFNLELFLMSFGLDNPKNAVSASGSLTIDFPLQPIKGINPFTRAILEFTKYHGRKEFMVTLYVEEGDTSTFNVARKLQKQFANGAISINTRENKITFGSDIYLKDYFRQTLFTEKQGFLQWQPSGQ